MSPRGSLAKVVNAGEGEEEGGGELEWYQRQSSSLEKEGITVALLHSLVDSHQGDHRLCPHLATKRDTIPLQRGSPLILQPLSLLLWLWPPALFLPPLGFLPLGYNRGDNRVQAPWQPVA